MPISRIACIRVISTEAPSTIEASTTWPSPGLASLDDRGEDPEREHHAAAAEVADEVEREQRPLALPRDRAERAGERDVVDVVAGHRGHRALLPVAGHPPVDELRVALRDVLGPEPEPLHHPRAKALDQRVGRRAEPQREVPAGRRLQIARRPRAGRGACSSRSPSRARPRPPPARAGSTSAPMSASIIAANGPGPIEAISTTLTPCSGPISPEPIEVGESFVLGAPFGSEKW